MTNQSGDTPATPQTGDRLWVTLDDPPSEFEKGVAEKIREFDRESSVFFVQVFSWRSVPTPRFKDVQYQLPKITELSQDRTVIFYEIGEETTLSIPTCRLMFSNSAGAGIVSVNPSKFKFKNQLLVVIACRQEDHDSGHASLHGSMDAIGYLSLVFGKSISEVPIFSIYFNADAEKFVSGALVLKETSKQEESVYGIKDFYKLDRFIADDDRTHAALWFAGKAFTEIDLASKIILYYSSIELICGKRMQDYFRNLYKGRSYSALAVETVKNLKELRNQLLHQGKLGDFSGPFERCIQVLLLDAIIEKQCGKLANSAFGSISDSFQDNNK